ncbi:MAG TPA: IclR family transcriptional regulator [Desulfobacterales bacterium]|nr:IclR family transcriptional regulator [Desulfobacterales bacterium]
MKESNANSIVQSMKSTVKTFQVLEDLCTHGASTALTLSQRLRLNRSSVHRILAVLQQLEYVRHEPGGTYAPTLHLYHLGSKVKAMLGISAIARLRMEALSEKVGATVSLVTLTKDFVITVLDRVFTRSDPRPNIIIDGPFPAYCTAFGKALLSGLSTRELDAYCSQVPIVPFTPHTVKNSRQLRQRLEKARRDGVALDEREFDESIRCIAAVIRDESGKVVAAVSVSDLVTRMTPQRVPGVQNELLNTAAQISQDLGYRGGSADSGSR